MVQPMSPTMTAPIAYSGGIAPKSAPGFGAQLSAMLGQLQATSSGLQALGSAAAQGAQGTQRHHHHGWHHGPSAAGGGASSPAWQSSGGTLSAANAGISLTA
ncbi:MAG TPA: hypothetical protein PK677_07115 [Acidiphilium sp.]|nr:hypothetical protein [Acidiphilium sp.]HQU23361.1 hypothetical protein [Acidiphilium sp.]